MKVQWTMKTLETLLLLSDSTDQQLQHQLITEMNPLMFKIFTFGFYLIFRIQNLRVSQTVHPVSLLHKEKTLRLRTLHSDGWLRSRVMTKETASAMKRRGQYNQNNSFFFGVYIYFLMYLIVTLYLYLWHQRYIQCYNFYVIDNFCHNPAQRMWQVGGRPQRL